MMAYSEQRNNLLRGLTAASIILFIVSNLMNFLYPGTEVEMGEVQRIFYVHLGSFFGAFLTFSVAVFAGIAYLRTRNPKWDYLGVSSVEIGLGLATINIVTGSVWARPSWGTFWTWEPRLTTIAIMWLTYAAYLFLRAAIEDPEQRRRFCSVYGILAFSSVILTIIIIRVRPDVVHPVVAGPSVTSSDVLGSFDVTPRIRNTVFFSILVYMVIATTLLWHRVRLENRAETLQQRKLEALENG
jgi:heme exporter protein C